MRHALIVATAQYTDPKLQRLRAPAADAERLAQVLRDPARGDFSDVEVLVDESEGTVTRRLARFFDERKPEDLLLLHFSCHGVKDDHGELFLAAADTEVDLLSATGVSAAWMSEQISRTRARRTIVLLDCCFSGSFPFGLKARAAGPVDAPAQLQGRGRVVITASSALEYAFEGDELTGKGRPSVFTDAVVEGLETGRADLDGDGLISVDELYEYVHDRVKERTPSQTPNMKSELQGQLYLAKAGGKLPADPAPAPADLAALRRSRKLRWIGPAAALVVLAVLSFVLLRGDNRDAGGGAKGGQTSLDALGCATDSDHWMIDKAEALSQDICQPDLTSKLPSGSLQFGAYASKDAALRGLRYATRFWSTQSGSEPCGDDADQALRDADGANATCFIQDGGSSVHIYWAAGDRLGALEYDSPATPADVIAAWRKLL
jgi:hypothetical protein